MARTPAISGRPAPQRKHRSSAGSSNGAEGAATNSARNGSGAFSGAGQQPRTLVSKAFKRAQKRAQLLAKTSETVSSRGQIRAGDDDEHRSARALLHGGRGTLSKSSLRRRKRKARDELARDEQQGRAGGVGELKDAVRELEVEMGGSDNDREGSDGDGGNGNSKAHAARGGDGPAAAQSGGHITAKQRKRMLAVEQTRQHAILADPTYRSSPFAALREHARHSMASNQYASTGRHT